MHYTHLISVDELKALHASDAPLLVFDCSSELGNPDKADAMFAEKHIAGAVQAHLERDLSAHDPANAVNGGRHPLPKRELFAQTLQALGFDNAMQAVVYDRNGANYCGRLWWMLKWAGHDAVAVLDGGLQAWEAAGGAVESGPAPRRARGQFALKPALRRLVHTDEVLQQLGRPTQTLIDARGAARYRGETEPLDPVAGHIPGALNRPFTYRPSSMRCWPGATPLAWCTTAAAASAPCPTCWPWNWPATRPPRCTAAAGANGAARRGCRWRRVEGSGSTYLIAACAC